MNFIAIVTIALLNIMGLFHLYWAFGGEVGLDKALPTKDGKRLFNPGRVLTFIVGIFLFAFAFVAYSLRFDVVVSVQVIYAGWTLSVLFILRALGEFNAVGILKKSNPLILQNTIQNIFPLYAYI